MSSLWKKDALDSLIRDTIIENNKLDKLEEKEKLEEETYSSDEIHQDEEAES